MDRTESLSAWIHVPSFWKPLFAAWALLVTAALSLRPVLPIDETRYLSVAWEMWISGDFLVPHLNGLPYSDKPPLLFWLFHLGWWLFGVNPWWPRLVPSLVSLTSLFLTAALARRLWPDRPRLAEAAPWVLLGFLLWSVFTTLVMFDMLVACCVLLALLGLESARRRGGWLPWLQTGAALGLGILAKGPVVFIVPLGVALLAPWWGAGSAGQGARGAAWWRGLLIALITAAAIALSWALPAARAGGTAYGNAILFSQTGERVGDTFIHSRPFWWYFALLPLLLFPYSLWPPLWRAAARLRALDAGMRFALSWAVPGLTVFSLFGSKQPHYLLPMLPAFALIAARLFDEPAPAPRPWHLLPPIAVLLVPGVAMAGAPWLPGWLDLPDWTALVVSGAGWALLAVAVILFFTFDCFFARRAGLPLLTFALILSLFLGFSRVARRAYDLEPLAHYLAAIEEQGRPIAYVGDYHGEFHFLGRLKQPFVEISGGAEQLWIREQPLGKVIQDLRYVPAGLGRADFMQPYRGDTLAVWGREALESPSG